jgi:succinate dehydrogenase/fumarate reductase flavoprotein subunit
LFAAGDASSRELICGGFTGGGSHNAAWAISSGHWAGKGAASYARGVSHAPGRPVRQLGTAALSGESSRTLDPDAVVRAVQAEVFPYDRNLFRTQGGLAESLDRLDSVWRELDARPEQQARSVLRGREAAAMVATGRFMYTTAQHRTETRGMHKHFPTLDPSQQRRLVTSGLEQIRVRPEGAVAAVGGAQGASFQELGAAQ